MAKCGLCSTKKGKRYCSPLDKVICPVCCAESRLVKINCNEDCRYLEGLRRQERRTEDKEFSALMNGVGHNKLDDIFHQPSVALMALEIESLVRDIYISGNIRITDTMVLEAYKNVYAVYFQGKQIEESQFDELTILLLEQYDTHSDAWKANMDEEMIGEVFLRLMISIKKMSGGSMGEYGYLNYLKNNLGEGNMQGKYIVEDKFGNKLTQRVDE